MSLNFQALKLSLIQASGCVQGAKKPSADATQTASLNIVQVHLDHEVAILMGRGIAQPLRIGNKKLFSFQKNYCFYFWRKNGGNRHDNITDQ